MPGTVLHRAYVGGLVAAWGSLITGGTLPMAADRAHPGDPGTPRASWPAGAASPLVARRPTSMIVVHRRYACMHGDLIDAGGGITPGRGERWDRRGRAAWLGTIIGTGVEGLECPVIGCPLATP